MTRTEAAAWLRANDRFCILTHRNPDGDTIGCAAALCRGLRAVGKTAYVLENPQFTPRYDRYLAGLTAPAAGDGDTPVAVDIASEELLPENAAGFAGRIPFAVDHHGSNTRFAERLYLEPETAACGELVFALLEALGAPLSREIAGALYLAVATDTGCFQYANTTASTLRVAAALKEAGCDAYPINKVFFGTKSRARLRLEARLTDDMEFLGGGTVAVSRLPLSWMEELRLTEDDVDSISGFPRGVEGVEIGVMLREKPGGAVKVSIRTGAGFNASAICAHCGGGGHRGAAGCTVRGSFGDARAAVCAALLAEGIEV